MFPLIDTVHYHNDKDIPAIQESDASSSPAVKLHITCFSFHERASAKLPPGMDLTLKLAEEILNDGFVTAGDPLRVTQPDALKASSHLAPWVNLVFQGVEGQRRSVEVPDGQIRAQEVGYSKGQARMMTLLGLIAAMMQDGITAEQIIQAN
jgi:hypothetical protein